MTEQEQPQDNSKQPSSNKQRMNRTKLVVIIAMAFVPIIAAYIVFFNFPGLAPTSRTNEGTLILPPVQGGEIIAANGKWTMLLAVGQECDAVCEQVLHLSRQIHISLGKNTPRVQRVVISQGHLSEDFALFLDKEHGNTNILNIEGSEFEEQLQQALGDTPLPSMVFMMDPNGNVMMVYPPEKAGKPMLKDLKLLLKLSNIG